MKKKEKKGRMKDGKFADGNNIGEGRNPIFSTHKDIEDACNKYFIWADDNPWHKNDVVRGGDFAGKPLQIPVQRPYTLIALCSYIKISVETWYKYEKKDGFSEITMCIRDRIDNQQFEGAMVGVFNASLTARRLGLADKKQHEGGDPDKPIHSEIITKIIFEDYSKQKPNKTVAKSEQNKKK